MSDADRLKAAGRAGRVAEEYHRYYRGKMETVPKCAVRSLEDFSVWYSPGVAEPCKAIHEDPELSFSYTNRWNTVAVVSDGSRVLGLGDIGPEAGYPVMEGKALLYKYLGGVDSVPIMLDTKDPDEIIRTVLLLQPSFGGINLEDIAQPKCFRILETLRREAAIPVWHDDQQGTATVTLAGLLNALEITGRSIETARIVFVGAGAANVATARLVFGRGGDPARSLVLDSKGILGTHRKDLERRKNDYYEKWQLCEMTNPEEREGEIAEALKGADVVISLSQPGPGTILPEWIEGMAKNPIVFACANPVPEIWPWQAEEAGAAVVATGRSDFPNQVNNSVCFPGIFRGAIDCRATTITDEMCFAAAEAIASYAREHPDYGPGHIVPTMEESALFPRVAAAVGVQAAEEGTAREKLSYQELLRSAEGIINRSQSLTKRMMEEDFIPPPPEVSDDV
jgi:malate dehydrogenase (oxaloacetate-decarboxylating)